MGGKSKSQLQADLKKLEADIKELEWQKLTIEVRVNQERHVRIGLEQELTLVEEALEEVGLHYDEGYGAPIRKLTRRLNVLETSMRLLVRCAEYYASREVKGSFVGGGTARLALDRVSHLGPRS